MSDRPADTDDRHAGAPAPWFGRRKRIVAREVVPEASPNPSADRKPADVIDAPARPAPARDAVLDPTLFSERQRKRGHNFAYRLTQLTTLLCILTAAVSIAFALLDHRRRAQGLALGACLLGLICIRLIRLTRLAYRLRGYGAAACILAAISLVVSLLPKLIPGDAPSVTPDGAPSTAPNRTPTTCESPHL